MAISDTQKVDFLEGKSLVQKHTNATKTSTKSKPLLIRGDKIWRESSSIMQLFRSFNPYVGVTTAGFNK